VAITPFTKTAYVKNQPQRFGQLNAAIVDVDFDSDCPSGGEAVTYADFGFGSVLFGVLCIAILDGADEVSDVAFDKENNKLIPVDEAGAYVTGDLSGVSVRLMAFGV
jgi:hypothetical protein